MYKATQGAEAGGSDGQGNGQQAHQEGAEANAGGDNVTDAEFEEVK
jgi:hypothetical protein